MSENAGEPTHAADCCCLDLDTLRPAALRAARLAKLLLDAEAADVSLLQGDRVWRGRDDVEPFTDDDFTREQAQIGDALQWVPNVRLDAERMRNPRIRQSPYVFWAGAPIILNDGRRIGVLRVADRKPHPYDEAKAEGLKDLAALVSAECDRLLDTRRLARVQLEAEKARRALSSFVEAAPSTTVMTDRDLCILHGSPSWQRDLGIGDIDLTGVSLHQIFPEMDRLHGAALRRSLTGEVIRLPPVKVPTPHGKDIWAQIEMAPWREAEGEIGGLIIMTQEVTAVMEAQEAAEAANRAKSTFLATMSHEIRTPLNGVLGMAQAMAADTLTDVQRDRITVIRRSGEALLGILNDILDLAKIEAGKMELDDVPFNLSETAQSACAPFAVLAEEKGLQFLLDIAPGAEGAYQGDATRFRQVLCNLTSNAVKFTDAGEVSVRIAREAGDLVLRVADSGIGLDEADQARLFGAFIQADTSATRRHGGTGLGLAISRQLTEMMGGALTLKSAPGAGSVFTARFRLPRLGDEAPTGLVEATETDSAPAVRILAAEDNAVNQLVLRTLLQQVGVDPVIVADGAEAVAAWRDQAWDVILMDVQMPVMDGVSATREIRRLEAERGAARTPIIALTANAMSYQIAEYLAGGMDAVIAKPFEIGPMLATLQQALEAAAEARAA